MAGKAPAAILTGQSHGFEYAFYLSASPWEPVREQTDLLGSGILENRFQTFSTTAIRGGMLRFNSSIHGVVRQA